MAWNPARAEQNLLAPDRDREAGRGLHQPSVGNESGQGVRRVSPYHYDPDARVQASGTKTLVSVEQRGARIRDAGKGYYGDEPLRLDQADSELENDGT